MATKKSEQPKATCKVLSPLDHDNQRYETGELVDLTEDEARPLMDGGVVAPVAPAEQA